MQDNGDHDSPIVQGGISDLTDDQLGALKEYARINGRRWKAQLNRDWMNASAGAELQVLRNTRGPTWLANFRLPTER